MTEVLELVSTDALLKLMPRQMAIHVRDGKPKTLEAAANLADDFVITRGWTYNVVTESDRSANQGRQHKKDERAHHLGKQHSSEVKQKSPNPQESTGKKSDQNGRGLPKFDKQNRPRCFECNQYGHFAAECHGKRRDGSKPKLEAINFAKPLTPRQESDLVITEVNRQTLVSGTVNGKSVNRVLLDTGAERTLVDSSLIQEKDKTGEIIRVRAFNGTISALSLAKVRIQIGEYGDDLTVAVQENLGYDALLGTDFPELWGVGRRLLYNELINVAQTRSQKRDTEHTSVPASFKEVEPETPEPESEQSESEEEKAETDQLWQDPSSDNPVILSSDIDVQSEEEDQPDSRSSRRKARAIFSSNKDNHPLDHDKTEFLKEQKQDETLKQCWSKANKEDSEFVEKDDLLWRKSEDRLREEKLQLCVPRQHRTLVLSLAHRPGHLGRDKTTQRILDDYFWPGVHTDVKKLCLSCPECQKAAHQTKHRVPLKPLPVIDVPFARIGMDMVGPLPRTKGVVVVDFATRWPEAIPLRKTDSQTIADELLVLFTRVGTPEEILTDCGTNFCESPHAGTTQTNGSKGNQDDTIPSRI